MLYYCILPLSYVNNNNNNDIDDNDNNNNDNDYNDNVLCGAFSILGYIIILDYHLLYQTIMYMLGYAIIS